METVKCEYCGIEMPIEDAHEYEGDYYCDDCWEELFVKCERCGEIIPLDCAYDGFDGYLCDCCHDDLFG